MTDLAHGDVPGIDASESDKAAYVLARYSVQNDHYVGYYQTWTKAILFLLGRHWLIWNKTTRRYSPDTDIPAWRQQPVTNVVYAVYRSAIAKLTKQRPTLEVIPPSTDSDDRESAHLAEALLVHWWRLCKVPQLQRRALGWFLCTGQTYIRVHWDTEAGKLVPLTQLVEIPHSDPTLAAQGETEDQPCPCGPDGQPITGKDDKTGESYPDLSAKPHMVPEGEIAIGIESPMAVRLNPEAESPEDATEMYVSRLWPVSRAAKHFKVKAEDLNGSDEDRSEYDDVLSAAASGQPNLLGVSTGSSQEEAIGPRCLIIEYYAKPDNDFPEGRHFIVCGKTKVWPTEKDTDYVNGEAPLPNGFWPPLIPVQSVPVPGQPQAAGLIPQVVPLNEALNSLDGKILEHHVTMAMGGKWIVHPDDRGLAISSDPAQVLASKGYSEGKPPIQADLKELPAAVYQEREVQMGRINLISGFNDLALGKKPEGVSSGRGFLVLQESVDSVLTPDLEAWDHAMEEVGRRMVAIAQKNYTEPRMVAIRGERGQWEVRSFTGADLADGLDIRVQVGSSFPWSKSAQWDARMSMLQAFPGLVQSPTGEVDKEALARYMDTGASGLSAFESDEDPDLVEVQREHAMFEAIDPSKGEQQVPQLGFWQSHPKHLAAHYEFMKRDYARFMRWTDAGKQAFLQHMQQTAGAVDAIAGNMAGPGGAPSGPPGAAPAPGPPPSGPQLVPNDAPGAGAAGPVPQGQSPQLTRQDFAAAGQ